MSVVKVRIQKDFVVLYNGVLENPRLSFKAKGLWAYCMSRPDNWQFHVNHLATVSKDGIDAVYSALKELEAEGLVEKHQENIGGVFGKMDYIIFPYPQEIQKILPLRDFPFADNPHPVNPPLPSIDSLPSTERRSSSVDPEKEEEELPLSKEAVKVKMRKIFIDYDDEVFETGWERYMSQSDSKIIFSPKKYLEKILVGICEDRLRGKSKEDLIEKHAKQAKENESYSTSYSVVACNGYVEFISGIHARQVPYDCSDTEWKEKTGWD